MGGVLRDHQFSIQRAQDCLSLKRFRCGWGGTRQQSDRKEDDLLSFACFVYENLLFLGDDDLSYHLH